MTKPFDAGSLLIHTAGLVGGDRAHVHGDQVESHQNIADCFSAVLWAAGKLPRDVRLDAHDAANMMEALKIARRYTGRFNPDDYIDGAGYASCAFECGAFVHGVDLTPDKAQPRTPSSRGCPRKVGPDKSASSTTLQNGRTRK